VTAELQELELKYAERIAKLLNQAENPAATEAEAQAFMEKAAKLMVEYAIDEQMIAAARGLTIDELVQDEFTYTGIYRNGHQQLGATVAAHFRLKCVNGHDVGQRPIRKPLFVVGFKSDVERARLLDTSLQLQCVSAMRHWAKTVDFSWMDKGRAFRTKRDFVFGFAQGVAVKLARARREAEAEAKVNEAERTGATATEASASVSLVLVSRKERVDEYYDTVWGGRTRHVRHNYASGARGGRDAGYAAGQNADTNTGHGLAGPRGAIGR
jgi:hypothetical protein